MNKRGSVAFISLFVISILIVGGIWYYETHKTLPLQTSTTQGIVNSSSSSANTNSNWIIYTNQTFGYSIQYPNNWFINTANSNYLGENGGTDGETGWSNYAWGTISGPPVPPDYHVISLEIYDLRKYPNAGSLPTSTSVTKLTTLSGVPGNEYIDVHPDDGYQQPVIDFINGNYVYQFSGDAQSGAVLNQMVATFKITSS